jgi:hypothetical protein
MRNIAFSSYREESCDEITQRLGVMSRQDGEYKCRDYLKRRGTRQLLEINELVKTDDEIDAVCREKMCEWSYKVADHFGTSREIVSFAFSFLDRFVDKIMCDRTAFKLAAMTSLYMATKIFNSKQISIASLADLSRGEFDIHNIAEMERIILSTLNWRLNPPTTQSFIAYLCELLPDNDEHVVETIYKQANFFAELAVFDYTFVSDERSFVAVACILSAMEAIDESGTEYQALRRSFLSTIHSSVAVDLPLDKLDDAQARLWYLFSCSAQDDDDKGLMRATARSPVRKDMQKANHESTAHHSPVSVQFKCRF